MNGYYNEEEEEEDWEEAGRRARQGQESMRFQQQQQPQPQLSKYTCPGALEDKDLDALERIDGQQTLGYVILTHLGKSNAGLMNNCVSCLGRSTAIHSVIYLPAAEHSYSSNRVSKTFARQIRDFSDLLEDDDQSIHEFRMSIGQYKAMRAFLLSKLGQRYDDRMVTCGCAHFFCSTSFMDRNCVEPGTQNCSRYVLHALNAGGVVTSADTRIIDFVYPGNIQRVVDGMPEVFREVTWDTMKNNVYSWYRATGINRRGVNAVVGVSVLGSSSDIPGYNPTPRGEEPGVQYTPYYHVGPAQPSPPLLLAPPAETRIYNEGGGYYYSPTSAISTTWDVNSSSY